MSRGRVRRGVVEPSVPARWLGALEEWESYCRRAGYAAATIELRRRYLVRVVATGVLPADPWQVSTSQLETALEVLTDAPVARRDARGTLRAFYRWATAAGRVVVDPAAELSGAPPRPVVQASRPVPHVRCSRPMPGVCPPLNEAWAAAVERWQTWCRAAGQSERTLAMRGYFLAHLGAACPDPWAATPEALAGFLAVVEWSPATRRTARGAVRSFYAWASAVGEVAVSPAEALPTVRVPPGAPRPAPDAVIEAARAKAGPRERLMVDLAVLAGLRRAEIARVHTADVESDVLRVFGKGGRVRLVPLHPDLLAQLAERPPGFIFARRDGHPITAGHVGRAVGAVLGPGWTTHTLRHAAGSRWYGVVPDVLAVGRLLGHSRPETTAVYAHVPNMLLRKLVAGT